MPQSNPAFVRLALKRRLEELKKRAAGQCACDQVLFQRMLSAALRTTVARMLAGGSFRAFSARLADSPLLQWFCRLNRLGDVRVPGKSQLQFYQDMVEDSELREVIQTLLDAGARKDEPLALKANLGLETESWTRRA